MNNNFYSIRVETLGCKLNQVESEAFASFALRAGFSIYRQAHISSLALSCIPIHHENQKQSSGLLHCNFKQNNTAAEEVVLCFVNTCTVTGKADQKARRLIRLLIKNHPHAVILVTGCYAQLNSAVIEALHPHVIAFPGQKKGALASLPVFLSQFLNAVPHIDTIFLTAAIRSYVCSLEQKKYHTDNINTAFLLNTPQFLFHSRALIKIQDGCNNACSYCCIRLARGKAVSLPAKEVLRRVQQIEESGISEVTLSGVNLSHYHSEEGDFVSLLKLLLANTQIRIRISSLYPDRIDDALAAVLVHPNICPHFHLSVQSGSNAILHSMNRVYTRETIYQAVERIRSAKQDPFIGVDIITGFPGETEHDFEDTYTLCQDLCFTGIHAFPFSPRPGTEAWDMKPKIPERIANTRVKRLHTLAKEQEKAYRKRWEGIIVYAITEATQNQQIFVTTENYLSLPLKTKEPLKGGEYLKVRICNDHADLVELIKY